MRLLVLTNFYPPYHLGGQERSCQEIVEGLAARGHDVLVLTSMHGVGKRRLLSDGNRRLLSNGNRLIVISRNCRPAREGDASTGVVSLKAVQGTAVHRALYLEMDLAPLRHSLIFFTHRYARERYNLRLLAQTLEEFRPQALLVCGMWNLPRSLPALAEAQLPGRVAYRFASYWPTLPSQHTMYWQAPGRSLPARVLKGLLSPLAMRALRRAAPPPKLHFKHAVCVSAATRDHLVQAGIPVANARIVHTGIDLQIPYSESKISNLESKISNFRMLYAGRLSPDKGVDIAIAALACARQAGALAGATLTIAGEGSPDYTAQLKRQVGAAGLRDHVTFLGRVPHSEVLDLMRQANVLLVPSTWPEPFARVVLEGMAAGATVIASAMGGAAEIIEDGINGLLVPAGAENANVSVRDAASAGCAWAEKITYLAANPALQTALARAGQETVRQRFTKKVMLDAYEDFLTSIAP